MISVAEAISHIEKHVKDFGIEVVPLLQSNNRILAADVFADRDFPPYDRVTMDGIAINSKAFIDGIKSFKIESIQAAGAPEKQLEQSIECIEIMTGAMLPKGADCVIPYEDCTIEHDLALVNCTSVKQFQNVHRQGIDGRCGDLLLHKGHRIGATTIAIMATVGVAEVVVQKLPRIAICSSGDELVDITDVPQPHQIRRSNSYMLAAALKDESIGADLYHLVDDQAQMHQELESILNKYEVVLLSGAVSKGKYDFLPEVLAECGMHTIFHRVAQRPGKPFLFGDIPNGPTIFGFPGNPVSTLVCYKVFFERWLALSLKNQAQRLTATLAGQVIFKPALTYHLLVNVHIRDGIFEAVPVPGSNSGDMVSLARANAIISLPPDQETFEKGRSYTLYFLNTSNYQSYYGHK